MIFSFSLHFSSVLLLNSLLLMSHSPAPGNLHSKGTLFKTSNDLGMSTAWLLATLGSKSSYKKLIKKDILNSSIPQTCENIVQNEKSMPLRMSSNLLYGLSLMYKLKVDFFMNEVSMTKARLQKDFLFNSMINKNNFTIISIEHTNTGSKQDLGQIFLNEDPLFDLNFDFARSFDARADEDSWKDQIKQLDESLYPDNVNSLHTTTGGQSYLQGDFSKTIENLLDRDLATLDQLSEAEAEDIDFEFDKDGEIIDGDGVKNAQKSNQLAGLDLIDFDIIEEGENNVLGDMTVAMPDGTIGNDRTFHISNDTYTNQSIQAADNKGSDHKRKLKKIITDDEGKLPSSELRNFRDHYEELMNSLHKKRKTQNIDISVFIREEIELLPLSTKFAYAFIYGEDVLRKPIIYKGTTMNRSVNLDAIQEDMEMGRNIDPSIAREETARRGFEVGDFHGDPDQSQDMFDLSFPDIDSSQVRSESSNNFSGRHQSPIGADYENAHQGEDSQFPGFYEESIDYTPGAPNLPTQHVTSQTKLSSTLVKFLNFLQSRAAILGRHDTKDYNISNEYFAHTDKNISREENGEYSTIKFSELVPLKKTIIDSREEPPASKKMAANSFSCILQLASRQFIILEDLGVSSSTNLSDGSMLEISVAV